eukprot:TRINITY_DN24977_c0_g1_i1.p1 TRINITY_DN24977_c0_g1~~TRINITY_DN24977_c0_g1_i1.p1  ORF type:complete len:892 (+),score=211.88 TRINITY_DN24977_c0_g1_i1:112-2787(+)
MGAAQGAASAGACCGSRPAGELRGQAPAPLERRGGNGSSGSPRTRKQALAGSLPSTEDEWQDDLEHGEEPEDEEFVAGPCGAQVAPSACCGVPARSAPPGRPGVGAAGSPPRQLARAPGPQPPLTMRPPLDAALRSALHPSAMSKLLSMNGSSPAAAGPLPLEEVVEEVGWLNLAVRILWPYAEDAVRDLLETEVVPNLKEALPTALGTLTVESFHLGTEPPVLGPVKVYKKAKQHHPGVEIDIGLRWSCSADISLVLGNMLRVGIDQLCLDGEISLVLKPLMRSMPIVGGIQIFMISKPKLEFGFTGAAAIAHFPVVCETFRKVVMDLICQQLVLPNRLFIHWIQGKEHQTSIAAMEYPMPEGLLRIQVQQARGLAAKDWSFMGTAKSDPYAKIQVGNRVHKTAVEYSTLAPNWGASGWADFPFYNMKQDVSVAIFDWDAYKSADFLGRLRKTSIAEVLARSEAWWPLSEIPEDAADGAARAGAARAAARTRRAALAGKTGGGAEVRIQARAFDFDPSPDSILRPPRIDEDFDAGASGAASTTALLTVELKHLRGLPQNKATGAICRVCVDGHQVDSIPSLYVEAEQDLVYDSRARKMDPATQRLVDALLTQHDRPLDELAHLSGIEESQLKRVIRQRPSFTCRWNHSLHILLQNPLTANISIRLLIPGEHGMFSDLMEGAMNTLTTASGHRSSTRSNGSCNGIAAHEGAVDLVEPFPVEQLTREKDMAWTGVLELQRNGGFPGGHLASGGEGNASRRSVTSASPEEPSRFRSFGSVAPGAALAAANHAVHTLREAPPDAAAAQAPPPAHAAASRRPRGPFDLEVHLRLWGLRPAALPGVGGAAAGAPGAAAPPAQPSTGNLDPPVEAGKQRKKKRGCCAWGRKAKGSEG